MSEHPYRTHTCGALRSADIGTRVRLAGWVHRVRDHGGIVFVDLRDHYGVTQVVIDPGQPFYADFNRLHLESVVSICGPVVERQPETRNPKLDTGLVEVHVEALEVLSRAEVVPISVNQETPADENLRLRYRFLDLRRETMHRHLHLRSRLLGYVREALTTLGFSEFQTPILTSSSPEGARDFLVPSRLHPGRFFALPQAPQIYKQLLMVAGFDRYFQIAPCFRDEDSRADRSPGEFYQIDLEMSFVTQDEVFAVVEQLMTGIFTTFGGGKAMTAAPFPRLTWHEARERYGTDKPDLRNPLAMIDVTDLFRGSGFQAFAGVAARADGTVRAIPVRGRGATLPRSFYDGMIAFAQGVGAKGLGYIVYADGEARSPIANHLDADRLQALRERCAAADGDVVFFIADSAPKARQIAAAVLPELGSRLGLVDTDAFRFCWIVDFPMYERDEETGRIDFSHNPFSLPQGGLEALETQDPLTLLAHQYDLVCNGVELSSGALRNHRPDIMLKAFEIAGYSRDEVESRFQGLMRAFQYGAPPHGGIAPGFDRILMLLTGARNIREVIAFPLNQSAQDPLLGAPSEVSERQLRELHLRSTVRSTDTTAAAAAKGV
ncbi:MAG: aspartate--tRNA ligase [Lentisphaerae bacterium]|nr:aspartate--tRNA ligase [Lentisphaerota bacterium]